MPARTPSSAKEVFGAPRLGRGGRRGVVEHRALSRRNFFLSPLIEERIEGEELITLRQGKSGDDIS